MFFFVCFFLGNLLVIATVFGYSSKAGAYAVQFDLRGNGQT